MRPGRFSRLTTYDPPPPGYAWIVCRYDVTTIASRNATASDIGTSFVSPSARLDAPAAVTNKISSVAYAVDEIGSDENVASAIGFDSRWCSCSAVDSGRPTSRRFAIVNTYRWLPTPHIKGALRQ